MSKLQLIYIPLLLVISFSSFAQVGIGTDTPDDSATLEIRSTTKGFLPPRMTPTQIRSISDPAEGLMVYCTTCSTKGVFVYDGKNFINIFNGEILAGTSNEAANLPSARVGIGTDEPDASAALEIRSTTKGFLLPRMTLIQIYAIIDNFSKANSLLAEGLMVYCTTCSTKGVFVYNGTDFKNIVNGNKMIFFDTTTEVDDVTSPTTGKTWMDRNLGATRAATSSKDEKSYGDLYQWGRGKDGHESRNSTITTTTATSADAGHDKFIIADDNWTSFTGGLWQSGLNDPCPIGYRIPTEAELDAERVKFSSQDATGAFTSFLKLPAAGYRHYTSASLTDVGSIGYYWSSTVSNTSAAVNLDFSENYASIFFGYRTSGFSVRCIKME